MGYDGKGQKKVNDLSGLESAWDELGNVPSVAEAFVNFDREVSIVAVYGRNSERSHYKLIENEHRDGILVSSVAPADASDEINLKAQKIVDTIAEHYGYVGVLVVEFFQVGKKLLVNEIAPRVHNSGHCTIEGAICSQFENHLRAVCGFPLGDTTFTKTVASFNILSKTPELKDVVEMKNAHLHLYDKEEKDMRKIGHITFCNHQDADLKTFLNESFESAKKLKL